MKSCQKATYLLSKKEEGKLTRGEHLLLSFHVGICGMCKKFEKQTLFIAKKTGNIPSPYVLSDEARNKFRKALQEAGEERAD